jgi:hypothetical protein
MCKPPCVSTVVRLFRELETDLLHCEDPPTREGYLIELAEATLHDRTLKRCCFESDVLLPVLFGNLEDLRVGG